MVDKGKPDCEDPYWQLRMIGSQVCQSQNKWRKERTCELQCFLNGDPYEGSNCCTPPTSAPVATPAPVEVEKHKCDDVPIPKLKKKPPPTDSCSHSKWEKKMRNSWCINHKKWRKKKYCQYTCYKLGVGYEGDNCLEPDPTPPPSMEPCTDEPSDTIEKQGGQCADEKYVEKMQTTWCNNNEKWQGRRWCAETCHKLGVGYSFVDCSNNSPTPKPTQFCDDIPTPSIEGKGDSCDMEKYVTKMTDNWCTNNNTWMNKKYCQLTCFKLGVGYEGDTCENANEDGGDDNGGDDNGGDDGGQKTTTPAPTVGGGCSDDPPGFMVNQGKACNDVSLINGFNKGNWCTSANSWVKNQYCAQTCFDFGQGYEGMDCSRR